LSSAVCETSLDALYAAACSTPSDMNEHCPTLRRLAAECRHVTEFGVRGGVSTAALLAGVAAAGGSMTAYDEADCWGTINRLVDAGGPIGFARGNSLKLNIDPTDLLMIDTIHTGWHIEAELQRHAAKVRRYIVMHDTETFGTVGDDGREGMMPAIKRFVQAQPEWRIAEHHRNSHGLTVLERTGETRAATVEVVVSAYRDNIDWLRPLQDAGATIRLYSKWENAPRGIIPASLVGSKLRQSHLPNVGMCDHTYLHHIVNNYDSLADWTVFTPDGPHDHLPDGVCMADAITPGDSLRVPRVWRGRDWGPDGRLNWHLWGDHRDRNGESWKDRYARIITPAKLSSVDWMRVFVGFDPDSQDWPGYAPGGVLAVPRRAVTYLPKAFYERLREQLSHSAQPEEGHYMERAWVVIFSGLARYQEVA
jgi:hypothetical protein